MNNYHTHTYRCHHASGTEKEMVETAISEGFQEIGISDHVPLPHFRWHLIKALPYIFKSKRSVLSWLKAFMLNGPGMRMPYSEKKQYLAELENLKQQYCGRIQIYKGFECEYFKTYLPYYRQLLERKEVDYLIFGHHYHRYSVSALYYGRAKLSKKDVSDYVDEALEAMQTGIFRYFAHPDLFFIGYHQWDSFVENEIKRMLCVAKQNDIILEINAGGLSRENVMINDEKIPPYPNPYFWQMVKEMDCKVMIGLDAHTPSQLDQLMYQRLVKFADKYGLKPLESLGLGE
jgi:Histidinol phosphatase and related hydrolases of the PHP family